MILRNRQIGLNLSLGTVQKRKHSSVIRGSSQNLGQGMVLAVHNPESPTSTKMLRE